MSKKDLSHKDENQAFIVNNNNINNESLINNEINRSDNRKVINDLENPLLDNKEMDYYSEKSDNSSKLSKTELKRKFKVIEETLDKITHGKQHITIIILCFLMMSIEGIQLTAVSYLLIPMKSVFNTNSFDIEFTAAVVFLGQGLGSLLIAIAKIYFTRKQLILSSLLLINVFQVLLAHSTSIMFFSLNRLIIGILLGFAYPLTVNVCCEYLPIKNRSFVMNSIYSGFNFGQIVMLSIMLYLMPNFEAESFYTVIYYLWIYIAIVTIIFFIYFEDSPRNLIFTDTEHSVQKGIEIYSQIFEDQNIETNHNTSKYLIKYIQSGDNKLVNADYSSLFKNQYFLLSILLIIIWMFNSFIRYGPILIYSSTLKVLNTNNNTVIILCDMMTSSITIVFCIFFAWLSEKKSIGLIKITLIVFIIALTFSVLSVFDQSDIGIWMSLYYSVVNAGNAAINTYTNLVYPTKIRDSSYGFFNFLKRVGAFSSQFIFLGLFNANVMFPYYLLFILNFGILISVYYLPIDPSKAHLDRDIEEAN